MKILCFGDSNTYGFDPRSWFGERYPADGRWVDILGRKLGCQMVNAGENGREIPRRSIKLERADLLIIMLGTNDLLQGHSPEIVRERMERFLEKLEFERSRILLVTPPPLKLDAWVAERSLVDASRLLDYGTLAQRMGIHHAGPWELPLAFDGVHLTQEGQAALAENLYDAISGIGIYSFTKEDDVI